MTTHIELNQDQFQTLLTLVRARREFCEEQTETYPGCEYIGETIELAELEQVLLAAPVSVDNDDLTE